MLLVKKEIIDEFENKHKLGYYDAYGKFVEFVVDKCKLPTTNVCEFCGEIKSTVMFSVDPFEEEVNCKIYVGEMCDGCYRERCEDI